MNAEYITSLYNARLQFGRYVAIPMFFIGFISEFLSIIVFLSLKTFRENSCAFYLLCMSLFNFIRLIFSLSAVTTSMAFTIDWSSVTIYYCQIRSFFHSTCTFGAIIILCLAVIDQYFATCTRVRWQRWSNIKVAHYLTLIVSIILTAQGVLYSIYFRQISPVNTAICISVNHDFLLYHTYGYFLVLGNLFPLIAVIFGIMAYRNARTLTTRV
ncbi:unnamed protein product, partial [Adineta steineri]